MQLLIVFISNKQYLTTLYNMCIIMNMYIVHINSLLYITVTPVVIVVITRLPIQVLSRLLSI